VGVPCPRHDSASEYPPTSTLVSSAVADVVLEVLPPTHAVNASVIAMIGRAVHTPRRYPVRLGRAWGARMGLSDPKEGHT
jgi:hypothetical protein